MEAVMEEPWLPPILRPHLLFFGLAFNNLGQGCHYLLLYFGSFFVPWPIGALVAAGMIIASKASRPRSASATRTPRARSLWWKTMEAASIFFHHRIQYLVPHPLQGALNERNIKIVVDVFYNFKQRLLRDLRGTCIQSVGQLNGRRFHHVADMILADQAILYGLWRLALFHKASRERFHSIGCLSQTSCHSLLSSQRVFFTSSLMAALTVSWSRLFSSKFQMIWIVDQNSRMQVGSTHPDGRSAISAPTRSSSTRIRDRFWVKIPICGTTTAAVRNDETSFRIWGYEAITYCRLP